MSTPKKVGGADVDATFIADRVRDLSTRIVEVDVNAAGYDTGHIPGAVLWNAYADLRHRDFRRIDRRETEELLARSGISRETTVVTYGYGAHLGYWLLRSVGHERVHLMDGPRDRWVRAGFNWSADAPSHAAGAYRLPGHGAFVASRKEVKKLGSTPGGVVVDVRSEAEYSGVSFWPSGAAESVGRPGHIPGAIHLPITSLRTSAGTFVDGKSLRRAVASAGVDRSNDIAVYCTIGNRASQAWYALTALLGFEHVRVYYGSWVEWGMDPGAEIAT